MAKVKNFFKKLGRYTWEFFKSSIPAALIYFCAGTVLMMLTLGDGKNLTWDGTKLAWTIVCAVVALAYNGLLAYAQGGNGYEMLVSGNIKRNAVDAYGESYKMSSHKEVKEYRPWKGFVTGAFISVYTIVFAILLACNPPTVNSAGEQQYSIVFLIAMLISGWSVLPFFYLNASGIAVSYLVSAAFGILPIAVSGVFYILGAYGRRNKTIKAQELADRAAAAEANKVKKINYGGLPGTKPRKRK